MAITVRELIQELCNEDMDAEIYTIMDDGGYYGKLYEQDLNAVDGVRVKPSVNNEKSPLNDGRVFLALDKVAIFKE